MQGKEARTVSYEKPGDFTPLEKPKKVVVRDAAEVELEKEQGFSIEDIFRVIPSAVKVGGDQDEEPEFTPGIDAEDISEELREKTEAAEREAERIVEAAREQADEIVKNARDAAEGVMVQAHGEGFDAGRQEGLISGMAEADRIKAELEEQKNALNAEYEQMAAELEPKFVTLVMELVEKMTGIVAEGSEDVILHLMRAGLKDVRKNAERIIVRVSQEDLPAAEAHKKELMEEHGTDAAIDIVAEEGMEKNECIIETDNQMLDAGIKTRLDNLMTAIRMLI